MLRFVPYPRLESLELASEQQNVAETDLVYAFVRHFGGEALETLLKDRSTGENIIWAGDEYEKLGDGYAAWDHIEVDKVADRHFGTVEPRVAKDAGKQAWRTRKKAEVFTPSWLCERMVDGLDDAFFGDEPAFAEGGGLTDERMAKLGEDELWKRYVDNRLLEITCGEAPFVCSPYDATTGDYLPAGERIGFLDRKLRVVSAFAADYEEWLKWAFRALEASYGYEFQGDNLLIARINVLNTFADHMKERWGKRPDEHEARYAALVASWNLWQMDGLTGCAPSEWEIPEVPPDQMSLFGMAGFLDDEPEEPEQMQLAVQCKIFDWRARKPQAYESLKG